MKVHKNGEYFSFEIAKNEISQIINDITLLKKNESKVMLTEYIPYVISQRIKAFRRGLYPTTKQIIAKEIQYIHIYI